MKKISCLILLFSLVIGCGKDSESNPEKVGSKPIALEVIAPQGYGSAGIKLMGRVLHLNNEKVLEHGFYLKEVNAFEETESKRVIINNKIQTGTNEVMFPNIPKFGGDFEIKYFIQTESKEYLSLAISFNYIPITVEPFSERNISPGETISVKGDFSKVDDKYYIVSFNDNSIGGDAIPFQLSADKKSLTFTISNHFGHGDEPGFALMKNSSVPIYLGRVNVLASLLPPGDFTMQFRDQIEFGATGFKYDSKKPFSIIVGNNSFDFKTYVQTYVSELIAGQKGSSFKLGYYNGIDTIYFSKPLTLSPPNSNDFYMRETVVHPNSSFGVSVYGLNLKMPIDNTKITVGNFPARVNAQWNGEDWLSVEDVPNGKYTIKFVNDLFTYSGPDKVTVKNLEVTFFSPSVIHDGDFLTINGTFINGKIYRIYSNNGMYNSDPAINGKIQVYLNDNNGDQFEITKVGYYDENLKKETLLDVFYQTVLSPVTFTHFSPLKGNDNTIKLYGEGLDRAMIFFNGQWMPAMDYGKGWVSFSPYSGTPPGKYKIAVFYKNKWLTVDQVYEYGY